jgi:DNA mismatch repair ATPase MutS
MEKLHSFVDVITNSSTVIYVSINQSEETIEKIKEFINKILIAGESNKTFDDLFYIKTTFNDIEDIKDRLADYTDIRDNIINLLNEEQKNDYKLIDEMVDKKIDELFEEHNSVELEKYIRELKEEYGPIEQTLIIYRKDNNEEIINLFELVNLICDIDSVYG